MGKRKTMVMEKLNVDWEQIDSAPETDPGILLNENGRDEPAAVEDCKVRPSRSNKTFRCTV
jgi:hypothetical protein